ncbi:MAG: glycosyl hydrolase [Desulfovermiculus sp.]
MTLRIVHISSMLLLSFLLTAAPVWSHEYQPGLLFGLTLHGLPVTKHDILEQEAAIGVPVRLITFYVQWPDTPAQGLFPAQSLDTIHDLGALACVTWEPMYHEQSGERMISAQSIVQGHYDPYLISFAQRAADWGHPFILRFAHEMNIQRYHWGTTENNYGPASPKLYRQMFRHVVSIFKEQGADNVLFAFCPNAESVPNTTYDPSAEWNTISAYYPGDEYVQVLGIDGYNWGTTQTREDHGWSSSWQSFPDIFAPAVRELRRLNAHKPLIIFETGSAKKGGDRDKWLVRGLKAVQDWNIQGLSWFQVDKEVDWSLHQEDIPTSGPLLRRLTSPVRDWISVWPSCK